MSILGTKQYDTRYDTAVWTLILEAVDGGLTPCAIGNPFLGTKLLGFSIGRGSEALKG